MRNLFILGAMAIKLEQSAAQRVFENFDFARC